MLKGNYLFPDARHSILQFHFLQMKLLYQFELFGSHGDPPDSTEIGRCHRSHWHLPAVTKS